MIFSNDVNISRMYEYERKTTMKALFFSLFLCLASLTVFAQEKPVAEIFGGYSFAPTSPETSLRRVNLNGGHANLTINGSFLDFIVDYSGHRGESFGTDVTANNFLVGTRFGRRGKKFSWYLHSLYGVSTITTNLNSGGQAASITTKLLVGPQHSRTSFAMVPGGLEVDVKINEKISYRLFQLDLLFISRGYPLSTYQPRLSTGIVIKLGEK
jgi:hypothetical protein